MGKRRGGEGKRLFVGGEGRARREGTKDRLRWCGKRGRGVRVGKGRSRREGRGKRERNK